MTNSFLRRSESAGAPTPTRRGRGLGLAALALSLGLGAAQGARGAAQNAPAQNPPQDAGAARGQDEILGPAPRPISVYVGEQSMVNLTFAGDYGTVRISGLLEGVPSDRLRVTDLNGKGREASWAEVRSLATVRVPSEGLPAGSFVVTLTGDTPISTSGLGTSGYVTSTSASPISGQNTWRLLRLPEGQVTVRSATAGRLSVPASRVIELAKQPVSGTITQLPKGTIRVEVLSGSSVSLPLDQVQALRRDVTAGTLTVALADGQSFTGKLVELPRVSIAMEPTRDHPPIALDQVVQLDVRIPTGTGGLGDGR